METKDKKLQDIETAYELIETTNFQRFVDILKGRNIEGIKFYFQDRVKEVPDTDLIIPAKEERLKFHAFHFDLTKDQPDQKLGLFERLHLLAVNILKNEDQYKRIGRGMNAINLDDSGMAWLNMPLVGQLWADSETLIKYRDKLLNWGKVSSTQPEGLPCLYTPDKLKILFAKLKDAGNLIDKSVTEKNFVATFQAGTLPDGWQKLKWIGSNPELATLVFLLTDRKTPTESIVNRYFNPQSGEYKSNSHRGRTNNHRIKSIVNSIK